MKHYLILFVFVFFPLNGEYLQAVQSRHPELAVFLNAENLNSAGVGFQLIEIESGKVIASHNENQALPPASVMKLISTAVVTDFLGSDYQIETRLSYSGKINETGILEGDIIVEGNNDATLGSEYLNANKEEFLEEWTTAIKKQGIKSVKGSIVVLDDRAAVPLIPGQWIWEDLGNYYAPCVYGISVFDNTFRMTLKSGKQYENAVVVKIEPEMKNLSFTNNILISNREKNNVYINGISYSYDRWLNGTMKENQSSYLVKAEIPDPALFLGNYFTHYLKKNAILIAGAPTTSRLGYIAPDNRKKIHSTFSDSLKKIIQVTNFRSNNHYAEYLTHIFQQASGTSIRDYLSSKGIDADGQFIYDGSGLAPANAISASFLTDVLIYMKKKSLSFEAYYRSIPLAGKEGTVTSFLKGTSLERKARIKSGSIANVQSYAGYIEHNGKQYAFALIVSNFTGQRAELRKQMERLLLSFF